MPTARAIWRSAATARMRRPIWVRSSRNHRAATSTAPTITIASGCRPRAVPPIMTAPLPRNGGVVRGAAPIVTVRRLLDHGGESDGRDEGRLGRPARERQDRDVRREHAGAGQGERDQRQQQETRQAEPRREQHRDRAAQHDEIAMREVDRARGVQREHEAQRHQRIGHAQRQGVQDELDGDQRVLLMLFRTARVSRAS